MKTIDYNEVLYRAAEAAGRTRDNLPLGEATLLKSVFALELRQGWRREAWTDLTPDLLAVTLDDLKQFANPWQDVSSVTMTGCNLAAANGIYTLDPATGIYAQSNGYTLQLSAGLWSVVDDVGQLLRYQSPTLIAAAWTYPNGGTAPATTYTNAPLELGDILGIYSKDPRPPSTRWERLDFYLIGDQVQVLPGKSGWVVPDMVYVHYMTPPPDLLALDATTLAATTLPLDLGNWLALRGAGHLLMADGAAALAGAQWGLADSAMADARLNLRRPVWSKPA